MLRATLLTVILLGAGTKQSATANDVGIAAPEGFEVTLFAGDDLATDIYSMTLDSKGRVVVAGRGYVKILHDDDSDGRADRATMFSEFPKSGAHGMCFDGNDLIATGDNLLMKLKDEDGDGQADGKPIPLANLRSPEHGANGIVQGPDGWFYVICGNDAGVGAQMAQTKTSPVKKPEAGAVLRFSPDFRRSEIFAHGFRNPYDLAFNADGRLFTVDADGERDQYLPWYAPTRLFDIQQGAHHGWVQKGWTRSWNRPESFFDNVPRLAEIGRGSPTGVECYRHYRFPKHYRGGIYSCCWTLGRVYYFPLTPEGSSYKTKTETFLRTTGDIGFAPVDLAVGPEGEMYVAVGGRGTKGSVFCVRYVGKVEAFDAYGRVDDERTNRALDVLEAPQPLAAWSRAKWEPVANELKRAPFAAIAQGSLGKERPEVTLRVRAVEIITEKFGGIQTDEVEFKGKAWAKVFNREVWSLAQQGEIPAKVTDHFAAALYPVGPPSLKRTVWESFLAHPEVEVRDGHLWFNTSADRRVRELRALAIPPEVITLQSPRVDSRSPETRLGIAKYREHHGKAIDFVEVANLLEWEHKLVIREFRDPFLEALQGLNEPKGIDEMPVAAAQRHRLDVVRLLQLALGDIKHDPQKPDVYAGYRANKPEAIPLETRQEVAAKLATMFPTDDAELNRELARLLAMIEAGDDISLLSNMAACINRGSRVQDDIHFLICLSRLDGVRTEQTTAKTAAAINDLHYKMLVHDLHPSRNWPLRVGETITELIKRDPKLPTAIINDSRFGLPEHAVFARLLPKEVRIEASRKMLEHSQRWGEESWNTDVVELLAELPAEVSLPALRGQWHDYNVRDAILRHLAKSPEAEDRKRFVDALSAASPDTVKRAAEALTKLDKPGTPEEILAALETLQGYLSAEQHGEVRQALAQALATLSEQQIATDETKGGSLPATYQPWFDWFKLAHAEHAKKLSGLDDESWQQRLAAIDFSAGDKARGKEIYSKRSCLRCHGGNSRLGPDLAGSARRYSNEDLLAEIVNPSRSVSPLYQTTRFETRRGKVIVGRPVYASPDGTLVQTGPDTTVRIAGDAIVSQTKSRQSLMPTGLLRGASDEEIADLFAYLKSLSPSQK